MSSIVSRMVSGRRRTLILPTAAALAGVLSLGAGVAPASAAPRTVTFLTAVPRAGVEVLSFKVSGRTTGDMCFNFGTGDDHGTNVGEFTDPKTGALTDMTQYKLEPGVYKVTSFSVDHCQNGFGTAGSTGYINTYVSSQWKLYTGDSPKRVR